MNKKRKILITGKGGSNALRCIHFISCTWCMKTNMTIDNIMENLRNEILKTLDEKNITYEKFSEMCSISYENLCKIIYGKSADIKVSTLLKICTNSGISYENILPAFHDKLEIIVRINGIEYTLKQCIDDKK